MKTYGYISDGTGKRYLLFWLYFALNDLDKFKEYIDWYREEFPDDIGEPAQMLCWALGLRRMGQETDAKQILAQLMLTNLYIIPQLLGESVEEYDIWHSSNYEDLDYYEYIPEELITLITKDDIDWIDELYTSFVFRRMRKKHIELYNKIKYEKDFESRKALLKEVQSIMDFLNE